MTQPQFKFLPSEHANELRRGVGEIAVEKAREVVREEFDRRRRDDREDLRNLIEGALDSKLNPVKSDVEALKTGQEEILKKLDAIQAKLT